MSLEQITYQTITNSVFNFLKTNCKNVDNNYSSITDNWFKPMNEPAWTAVEHTGGGNWIYTCINPYYKKWSVTNIPYVSSSTIKSDISAFLSQLGINENSIISTTNNFIKFFCNILSFASYKTAYVVSPISQDTIYMIYHTSGTPPITAMDKDEKIYAQQILEMFTAIMDTEYQLGRFIFTNNILKFGDYSTHIQPNWATSETAYP